MQESSPQQGRAAFWWKALQLGTTQLNAAAGWLGLVVLLLGIAGVVVPLVFDLSPWLIAVILLGLLVLVVAEGGYQVWHDTEQARITAVTKQATATTQMAQQAAAEQKASQAKLVQVWATREPDPRRSQAQGHRHTVLIVHVKNDSQQVIRHLQCYWYIATEPWGNASHPPLPPGAETTFIRDIEADLPAPLPANLTPYDFTAVVHFRDANQAKWRITSEGILEPAS